MDDVTKSFQKKNENLIKEENEIKNKFFQKHGNLIKEEKEIKNQFAQKHENLRKEENNVKNEFILKHEKLLKEENDLKEKLENEVTKVKEKLENAYSEYNKELKINEKINKGIEKLGKEEKTDIFKNLSYISKININRKSMDKLMKKDMTSLKFEYKEEKNNINYEEYWFNAEIDINININIEYNYLSNVELSWDNNKINNNIDLPLKFEVLIRRDNKNENFSKVYEGKETKCNINNLLYPVGYEIKLNIYSNQKRVLSIIKKFKTKTFDSKIINDLPEEEFYIKKLYEWTNSKELKLLYRSSREGFSSEKFHNLCDNNGSTITLFKNEKGNIFGGYSPISWISLGGYRKAPSSFLFTLSNIYKIEPTIFPSQKKRL